MPVAAGLGLQPALWGREPKPSDIPRSPSERKDSHNLHAVTCLAVTNAIQGPRAHGACREERERGDGTERREQ